MNTICSAAIIERWSGTIWAMGCIVENLWKYLGLHCLKMTWMCSERGCRRNTIIWLICIRAKVIKRFLTRNGRRKGDFFGFFRGAQWEIGKLKWNVRLKPWRIISESCRNPMCSLTIQKECCRKERLTYNWGFLLENYCLVGISVENWARFAIFIVVFIFDCGFGYLDIWTLRVTIVQCRYYKFSIWFFRKFNYKYDLTGDFLQKNRKIYWPPMSKI